RRLFLGPLHGSAVNRRRTADGKNGQKYDGAFACSSARQQASANAHIRSGIYRAAVDGAAEERLARISHGAVRNAHGVPIRHWRIGASREGFRPGKLLSKQLATGDLLIRRGG